MFGFTCPEIPSTNLQLTGTWLWCYPKRVLWLSAYVIAFWQSFISYVVFA